jgi:hypothetical protein
MHANGMQNDVLAVETHASRAWCLIVLPVLTVPVISATFYPRPPVIFAVIVTGVVGLGVLAMIWSGFEYRFTRHAVEVWTLGFKLRTIPKSQIVSYSIESWSLPRGYGIRGIGNRRAYVWGNKVVHIKMTNADIYLGHDDPEKIVRDLDQVTGLGMSGASAAQAGGRSQQ